MRELFLLDPEIVYLNHGSFGACPRPVFEDYQRWQRELERQPVEFLGRERRLPELLEPARLRLAAYVGSPPGDLAFATNASSALNTAIRCLELHRGDEVLLGDAEYGGLEILWQWIAARTGATLRRVPFAELEPGPKTRVVFCSHIEWTTGQINDVATVCAAARAAGALSVKVLRATTSGSEPGVIRALDLKGLSVSGGSACQSGASEPSHVLTAMGLTPTRARATLRFSLSKITTEAEIDEVLKIIPAAVAHLRELSPTYKKTAPVTA